MVNRGLTLPYYLITFVIIINLCYRLRSLSSDQSIMKLLILMIFLSSGECRQCDTNGQLMRNLLKCRKSFLTSFVFIYNSIKLAEKEDSEQCLEIN